MPRSRVLLPLALSLLVIWSATSVWRDVSKTARNHREQLWSHRELSGWRFGTPAVEQLRSFAAEVDARIPAGEVVAFSSHQPEGSPPMLDMVRFLWAAYLLPRHRLLRAVGPESLDASSHWVTYGTRRENPRAELVWQNPEGAIYRIRP